MQQKFSNKLIFETSPYLLQHAHNPVDWYPWGEEALERSRVENKPILVSIGYSACHWCHVMERESFENEETAAIMNAHFINIKIDREERPDLDQIYMDAVQAISGSGGWPLNVFLTPDKKPFYGGTYFPPVNAYNRSSWPQVLNSIKQAWNEKRNEIEIQADNLLQHLEKSNLFENLNALDKTSVFTRENCRVIFENILKTADTEWGGFGSAPKFPQTFTIQFLLQHFYFTNDKKALQQALLCIDKMLQGGIYDQAGGGISRYSTDKEWLAPHFEKMLYDNALFINVLCDAYQLTNRDKYRKAITQTIDFLQREMLDPRGGFYAALDADSEGEEGRFYVWTKKEIEKILAGNAALFCSFFDVQEDGNWEHKNILRTLKPIAIFAAEKNIPLLEFENRMDKCLLQLLAERNKRVRPQTDDKILLGWNAMMITALCKAYSATGVSGYKKIAEDNFEFLLKNFSGNESENILYHTFKNGIAKYPAFLDDIGLLIQASVQLQEISSNQFYLLKANELTTLVIDNFLDPETGFFFYTQNNQSDIIVRKKEVYDGATPSGNSIMAENLFYLAAIMDKPVWFAMANKITTALSAAVIKYPVSFAIWAAIIQKQAYGIREIVVAGPGMEDLRMEILKNYLPNKIFQCTRESNDDFPLLTGKIQPGKTLIFLCRNYHCKVPVETTKELLDGLT
jgi:uncharacterized protein YyaL (SSP411 family)